MHLKRFHVKLERMYVYNSAFTVCTECTVLSSMQFITSSKHEYNMLYLSCALVANAVIHVNCESTLPVVVSANSAIAESMLFMSLAIDFERVAVCFDSAKYLFIILPLFYSVGALRPH